MGEKAKFPETVGYKRQKNYCQISKSKLLCSTEPFVYCRATISICTNIWEYTLIMQIAPFLDCPHWCALSPREGISRMNKRWHFQEKENKILRHANEARKFAVPLQLLSYTHFWRDVLPPFQSQWMYWERVDFRQCQSEENIFILTCKRLSKAICLLPKTGIPGNASGMLASCLLLLHILRDATLSQQFRAVRKTTFQFYYYLQKNNPSSGLLDAFYRGCQEEVIQKSWMPLFPKWESFLQQHLLYSASCCDTGWSQLTLAF